MGARNHHFVPQYYLKGFAKPRSKDGKLTVFDIKDRKYFVTRPRNVAARRDYNRIEIDGVDPNAIEKQYSIFEGLADQAFRRIIESRSIKNMDDFSFVLALLGLVSINNPSFRAERDKIVAQMGSSILRNLVSSPERWEAISAAAGAKHDDAVTYEAARKAVINGDIVVTTVQDALIRQEIELWPEMSRILHIRKWTLLVAPKNSGGFVTSDRPFSLRWNDQREPSNFHGPGLGSANTTLIFPLNRDLAVIGRFEEGGGVREVNEHSVGAINYTLFQSAIRQLYTTVDFPILDIDRAVRPFSESKIWHFVRERPVKPDEA